MKMKKILAFLLIFSMLLASLSACGKSEKKEEGTGDGAKNTGSTAESVTKGNVPVNEAGNPDPFGKYERPVTVSIVQQVNATDTIPEGQSATDNQYTRYVKDMINIDTEIKWQAAAGADFLQKVNLAIASNDLPDVMVVNEAQFRALIKSDMIEDLTPYFETYASDTIKTMIEKTEGKAMEAVTVDGKMLALPGIQVETDGYNLMWIRQDWLDTLGLEAPKTVEDLEKVALAFIENKMGGDNTVGILGPTANNLLYHNFLQPINSGQTVDAIFAAYGAYPGMWITDDADQAIYGSITDETRTGLIRLREMYQSGALDPELGTRKDAGEAWKSGTAGIFFAPWWTGYAGIKDAVVNDPKASWVAYGLPLTEKGEWNPRLGPSTQQFTVVRKGYEHPEAAILLANYLVRDEKNMDTTALGLSYYPARSVLAAVDECTYTVDILDEYLKTGTVPEYDGNLYKLLDNDIATVKEAKLEPYDDMHIEYWNPDNSNFARMISLLSGSGAVARAQKEYPNSKVYSLVYSQTETMEKKWTNLKKLEDEIFLKIILGTEPVEAFDTFVERWKAEGGDEITAEVQATRR